MHDIKHPEISEAPYYINQNIFFCMRVVLESGVRKSTYLRKIAIIMKFFFVLESLQSMLAN